MKDCIFCQIVAGKIPSYQTYENQHFLGFLDIKPLALGNSLLIPKKHYRWVTDVENFGDYWKAAQKLALATQKAVSADYISFLTIGMEVEHAHICLIPRFYHDRFSGRGITIDKPEKISPEKMAQIAQKIRSAF